MLFLCLVAFASCERTKSESKTIEAQQPVPEDTVVKIIDSPQAPSSAYDPTTHHINTGTTTPEQLILFAKTLMGIPYKYASTDPAEGFDCSGFITYVFNHFNVSVPRSSIDFTNVDREVSLQDAKPGDLILFTGTDSTERVVGHMGIIVSNDNEHYEFIHSTSGKANGVTITPLNDYYMGRFVKVLRVFPQNE